MEDIPNAKPKMHVFICTNDRTAVQRNTAPSCGPTVKDEDVKAVKLWLREQGLTRDVYCTKVKCLGFCNPDGGVMCIYPRGRFVKGLKTVEDMKQIIREELFRIS